MPKKPGTTSIGPELKAVRGAHYLSKTKLGKAARVSTGTIRRVERGQCYLSSFKRIADVLGLELRGRGLPPGPVGPALKEIRLRRHISVHRLACMLEASSATIKRLEKGGPTRLDVLEAYGNLFGVELYLAARPTKPNKMA
jgi:predicted transcriptional regulator